MVRLRCNLRAVQGAVVVEFWRMRRRAPMTTRSRIGRLKGDLVVDVDVVVVPRWTLVR